MAEQENELKDLRELSFEERCKYLMERRSEDGNWELGRMFKPQLHHCDEEKQIVEICFPIQNWQLNPRAELHGGLLATFFDMAMGITAYSASGQWQCATTDLSVSFLRPLCEGDTVCIHCDVAKAGKNMIFISGKAIAMNTGKTAGIAQGTFLTLAGVGLSATSR